jgi:membrane-associated phospholipid phosphatase
VKPKNFATQVKKNLDLLASMLLLIAFYSSVAVMFPVLNAIDIRLVVEIVGCSNPTLDLLFGFLTMIGGAPFWLLIIGLLWLRRERRAATFLIVGILADVVLASFLKIVFARPRPYEAMPQIRTISRDTGGSFPSDHAERTFASAFILSRFYRRWTWALFGLGVLVAFTRVYTANHYPLDTVAGAVNGLALGAATLRTPIDRLQARLESYWTRLTRRFSVLSEALRPVPLGIPRETDH